MKTSQDFFQHNESPREMPLVAEKAGIWHWLPVDTLLING
jgi:hypothetical protein